MVEEVVDRRRVQFEFAKRSFEAFLSERERFLPYLKPQVTPVLYMDLEGIKSRYIELRYHLPQVKVYYAVKANDHPEIIRVLAELGSGFEVASSEELRRVLEMGVSPDRVISSNPVKPMDFIEYAYSKGVDRFAVDSFTEVDKLAKVAKRSRVYVRLVVPNEGSDWPLSKKFGVDVNTALDILEYAREKGLIPYGVTFHVGSQCNNYRNWFIGIRTAAELWSKAKERGLRLQMLNLGGGIPVRYTYEALSVEDIAYYVRGLLQKFFPSMPHELQIEPGRGIVGDQGIMVTRVIGKARRGNENWIYIDTGVFNGLAEALGGIRYAFYLDREGELEEWTIGGVSCDSMDVVARSVPLPEPEVGDYLYILSAGAYTTVYAANFNGFPVPQVVFP
ncbi:Orn/DAP/Arg decarboxylase 2 [Thermocrinis albus DSM 14484]|uniref:ornithine decarboxylase n=1 Tax=Thermocrinis albus (strain DSM 14484 / JCM 11386 / HI 11/12) TaxID=638303 RepID=D3SP95_THEAH|nr:type III PLP-dependent enzyme [Thermocrinis albus]ADC88982.1 Orn/DAP/Arg decarboxylase 2 [Thermocrinis albus DSM 14484]